MSAITRPCWEGCDYNSYAWQMGPSFGKPAPEPTTAPPKSPVWSYTITSTKQHDMQKGPALNVGNACSGLPLPSSHRSIRDT